jgi:hypothetical protein
MNFQQGPAKVGYTRSEFGRIFQIYSQNVYSGLFRDFSFAEINGQFFISFKEEAGKTPLITVEKRRLGPDRALFVATTPGPKGQPLEIVRSEKVDIFVEKLKAEINDLREKSAVNRGLKVVS